MKKLMNKQDISDFMDVFETFSRFDENGSKHYFTLEDRKRGGNLTLMKYADRSWSFHGIGEDYCDENETVFSPVDMSTFIWQNRAAVNASLKMSFLQKV